MFNLNKLNATKKHLKYKIYFLVGKIAHIIIPNYLLLNLLKKVSRLPRLGWKIITYFDPNLIRKLYEFDLKSKVQKLKGDGWELYINTRDHIGFYSFLRGEPFELTVLNIGKKLKNSKKNIIIDIGANIGSASIPLCAKNNYELIAIEPSKENASILLRNILINKIKSRIFICALTEKNQNNFEKLNINKGNTASNSLIKGWNPSKYPSKNDYELVETKTLDEIINYSGVSIDDILIIKIDVEGMEELVLKGATNFLELNSAPILIEYRKDMVSKYISSDYSELLKILKNFHYQPFSIDQRGNLHKFFPNESYENIIALPEKGDLNKFFIGSETLK